MVITEAGYWGCPSISVRAFAIPELIQNGVTGFLLPTPVSAVEIAETVLQCLNEPEKYAQMRVNTRMYNIEHHTWRRVAQEIANIIEQDFHQ